MRIRSFLMALSVLALASAGVAHGAGFALARIALAIVRRRNISACDAISVSGNGAACARKGQ